MIWKSTKDLGCAIVRSGASSQCAGVPWYFCQYANEAPNVAYTDDPYGNYIANVPQETAADKAWRNSEATKAACCATAYWEPEDTSFLQRLRPAVPHHV